MITYNEKRVCNPTVNILVGLQSAHMHDCIPTVNNIITVGLQSYPFYLRVMRVTLRHVAFTVGILLGSTNREIDYDVTTGITVGILSDRQHSDCNK